MGNINSKVIRLYSNFSRNSFSLSVNAAISIPSPGGPDTCSPYPIDGHPVRIDNRNAYGSLGIVRYSIQSHRCRTMELDDPPMCQAESESTAEYGKRHPTAEVPYSAPVHKADGPSSVLAALLNLRRS